MFYLNESSRNFKTLITIFIEHSPGADISMLYLQNCFTPIMYSERYDVHAGELLIKYVPGLQYEASLSVLEGVEIGRID